MNTRCHLPKKVPPALSASVMNRSAALGHDASCVSSSLQPKQPNMHPKPMHQNIRTLLVGATLLIATQFVGGQAVTNWVAFNDHVPGPGTAPNANAYNLRGTPGTPPEPVAGFFTNFLDGAVTPAFIISEATGAPDYFGTMAYPNAGTPAYNLFNGIVDVGNVNSGIGLRSSAGTTTTLTFSNLNPSQRYILRGTSARGGNYPRRWTLVSLMGADSFVDAHTTGVFTRNNFPTGTMTNGQAAYDSGENRADGALVGWDNINPGSDGVFKIKCEQYIDSPLPNGDTPDLAAYGYALNSIYLAELGSPTPPVITVNPPANVTLVQNRPLTLSGNAQGAPLPTLQWYKDDMAVAGATSRTFSVPLAQPSDSGDYYLVAGNSLNQATSTVARVTVYPDTNGPVLLSVRTDDTFQTVTLNWDEIMDPSPTVELGNFQIQDSLGNPIGVTSLDYQGSNIVLHVPVLQPDATYSIEIDFQQDLAINATVPVGNPQGDQNGIVTNFHTWAFTPGFTRFQAYLGLSASASISEFVGLPVYPNSPTLGFYTNVLYWPQTAPNVERYAMRFTGVFVAPESGTHRFDPAHDDDMRLRVYPGENPSGTPTELAAPCCTGLTGGPTLDIDLTAGQRYYYELIVRENGGGDYAGLAVTLPSGTVSSPIDSQFLAIAANPTGASVTITQQPADQTFVANPGVSLFANDFNADNGGFTVTTPQAYDGPWMYNSGTGSWQQNGQETEDNHPNTSLLDSPPLTITASGEVILSFEHRYSFEQDTTSWDGGQVRVSVNGGPFIAVPSTSFTSNSYNGAVGASTSLLAGQPAFVGNSPGFVFITSVATLGRFNAGDTLRVEFMAAGDGNTTGSQTPDWEINAVQLIQGSLQTVTFSVRASEVNESGTNPPQAYQWLRYNGMSFVPIFRATTADYTFAPQPSDDGAQFRAIVFIPGASATSAIATLNGAATGPRLAIRRGANNTVAITWPASFATYILESAPTVPSATWTTVAHMVVGGENIATISLPATGNAFYRLKAPIP
jgi:hypothetical protein